MGQVRHRAGRHVALAAALGLAACTPSLPGVHEAPATAPAPQRLWTPPAALVRDTALPARAVPPDLEARLRELTLADVVDMALRNSPATREAWATARAAAATYGFERGALFPQLDVSATGSRLQTVASQGRVAVQQWVYGPSATLSFLLFDFGGRSGAIEGARQALIAADFTHNAVIQNVVLQTQVAYFNYLAQRALLSAQRETLRDAEANLAAAEERRRVGVATIAEVLQARTAASQARLAMETTEGARQTARGALALALGLPANIPYDVDTAAIQTNVAAIADSVDTLIVSALKERPDLAAARADALSAAAAARQVGAARWPALTLNGTGGRTYTSTLTRGGNNYTVSLGLQIPIFSGFSAEYAQRAASERAAAAQARLDALGQQVAFQVFAAYYAMQTATRRVGTAADLIASAEQSADATRARYREGVGSVLDLLSAQAALADARAQQVQSRLDWHVALAQLAHDAGLLDTKGHSPLRFTTDTTTPGPSR